ncbi:MAG: carboxypeptidase-like regulatory domain-containing protein, partial [Bacteroidia bacterium]|nr:carboxypeptidase-like regulatory domain-containing protein [Bacteroidia bacterium]
MKKRFLLAVIGIMTISWLNAQVKGKVVEISEKGDTTVVPGVILVWENTVINTTTDQNGDFTLKTSEVSNKLHLQAVGYETKIVTVKDFDKHLLLVLKSANNLNEIEVVYFSSGTEISYLNPIKTEILTERSLMKAACFNLSESFETNPSIDVNFADAISGTKQIQMLGLSGQYAQITKENMPYLRGLANNYGLTFVPGTWIQSIQLSKGAGSVVNGYESFTGQINTELQNPEHTDQLHFNAYGNENGRNEYNLNLSRRFNPKFSAGILSHASFNPLAQDLNGD